MRSSQETEKLPRFLGVRDVAEYFGVSLKTVYDHVAAGKLGAVRFGRRVLIPRSEIERLVEGR